MEREVAIRLEDITKTFGEVVANSHVNLEVYRGEILSLLGENGSGKTTPGEHAFRHLLPGWRKDLR